MQNLILILLLSSTLFLVAVSFFAHHFLALYYVVWIFLVGGFLWKKKVKVEEKLAQLKIGSFKKFILLGVIMIFLEETLAGISMHLSTAHNSRDLIVGVLQFWAFNLLALPGFIIGWYLLLCKYNYSRREVFVLVGLFGLFSESVVSKILANPIMGTVLILPTMFTYSIIIAPSIMSFRGGEKKSIPVLYRYIIGFFFPIIVSLPFLLILMILKNHFPYIFPPIGFVV